MFDKRFRIALLDWARGNEEDVIFLTFIFAAILVVLFSLFMFAASSTGVIKYNQDTDDALYHPCSVATTPGNDVHFNMLTASNDKSAVMASVPVRNLPLVIKSTSLYSGPPPPCLHGLPRQPSTTRNNIAVYDRCGRIGSKRLAVPSTMEGIESFSIYTDPTTIDK